MFPALEARFFLNPIPAIMKLRSSLFILVSITALIVPAAADPVTYDFSYYGETALPGTVAGQLVGTESGSVFTVDQAIVTSESGTTFSPAVTLASHYENTFDVDSQGGVESGGIDFYSDNPNYELVINGVGYITTFSGPSLATVGNVDGLSDVTFTLETPEPGTCALVGLGLASLLFVSRARRSVQA